MSRHNYVPSNLTGAPPADKMHVTFQQLIMSDNGWLYITRHFKCPTPFAFDRQVENDI